MGRWAGTDFRCRTALRQWLGNQCPDLQVALARPAGSDPDRSFCLADSVASAMSSSVSPCLVSPGCMETFYGHVEPNELTGCSARNGSALPLQRTPSRSTEGN